MPASFGKFAYGFLNKMSATDQRRIYDEQATPETGRIFFQAAFALLDRRRATQVNFRNASRGPLLITSGSDDHNVRPAMVRSNHRKYRGSPARTDYHEFARRTHWVIAEAGWDEVAAYVERWIECLPA